MPSGGQVLEASALLRNAASASMTWKVEAATDWDAYRDWARARLSEYHLAHDRHDTLRFSRRLEGDILTLSLEKEVDTAEPKRLVVRVSFLAVPY